jgi:hypothetical protein
MSDLFVTVSNFDPELKIAVKAGAYLSGASHRTPL